MADREPLTLNLAEGARPRRKGKSPHHLGEARRRTSQQSDRASCCRAATTHGSKGRNLPGVPVPGRHRRVSG
jgi:hypothetical protein